MLDIHLRPLKDTLFNTITPLIPSSISPLHITLFAFLSGLQACYFAATNKVQLSVFFWFLNRALDCLDGAVARKRNQASDLGGFYDLLGDFIVYSAIPVCRALGRKDADTKLWLAVAVLEASFHVNNFVLFYVGAVLEKRKNSGKDDEGKVKELTSIAMRPALIEGAESAVFFTIMLVYPQYLQSLSWSMALLVAIGIVQRSMWLARAL
jgi:phosphatidylglycerophosphate synthase